MKAKATIDEGRIRAVIRRARMAQEGNSLVEMALVSAFVFLPTIFAIVQFSLGVYAYNFVNMAARQATRYAAVRGAPSCLISSTFPNCNLNPSGGSAALQTYVQGMAYPGIDQTRLTVTGTWLSRQVNAGLTTFSNAAPSTCGSTTGGPYADAYGQVCNTPGNAVQVTVAYDFPLSIPFWRNLTLTLKGTSQMVINE